MSKLVDDSIMDAGLNAVINNAVILRVCSGDPADRAAAVTNTLASVAINSGDFTLANGDTSGRKYTLGQQADISISVSGTAATIVVDDGATLLTKTDVTPQALTSGGTVTVNAYDHEIADAA
jgi:hypothetical protein